MSLAESGGVSILHTMGAASINFTYIICEYDGPHGRLSRPTLAHQQNFLFGGHDDETRHVGVVQRETVQESLLAFAHGINPWRRLDLLFNPKLLV